MSFVMEENNTLPSQVITLLDQELINDQDAYVVFQVLFYCVTPTICALGLTGNVLSMKILYIHGLNRCSNILLFSLAICDTCYLIGFNNIANIIYVMNGNFPFSRSVSYFLYFLYLIFLILDYGVGLSALTIPMLITTERFVAVFFPLKFSRIVTPPRVWFLVACVLSYWMTYIIYSCFWFEFSYVHDENVNTSYGLIGRSALFYRDLPQIQALNEIYFSMKIPPSFTLCGCILIVIRLKYVASQRSKITNTASEKSNLKTTQMLLVLCFVYLFACIAVALPTYLPEEWIAYSLTSADSSNLGRIMYQVMNIIICVNSSWNFIIYVGVNKNFRDIFKGIIGNCCQRKAI